jgi:hypothetical protein
MQFVTPAAAFRQHSLQLVQIGLRQRLIAP